MPGPSKVIVLDPDVRAGRQIQLGFQREGLSAQIAPVPVDLKQVALPTDDAGLVVIGGSDDRAVDLVRRTREVLEAHHVDAPIVFAGRGAERTDLERAGADEVVAPPAYLRDVVTIGRLLVGQPANQRRHLVGNLGEITGVLTLVRALSALGRSAVLTLIRGLRRGEVRFFEGEVTSAQVGLIHGQAALHQLLLWTDARFDFHHEDIVRRQQIPLDHDELFADAERFLAGIRDSSGSLSPSMVLEQDVARIHAQGKQIPSEVHGVLRMFDGHRVLADVLEDSPYRVFETLRVAQRALDVGLLRKASAPRPKATWRAVLAIEEWLVGSETRDDVVARGATDNTVPVAKQDITGKTKKTFSKKHRKKKRVSGPLPVATPATKDVDWGALVPRSAGQELGPLAGVVPAAQRSGEIVLPAVPSRDEPRERLEALMDTGKRERIFPTDIGLEPSVVLDDGAADRAKQAEADAAAKAKAEADAAAKAKAEADAAAKAKAEADADAAAKAKADADAAAKAKADADAAAKAKAEADAKADADARAKADALAAAARVAADAETKARAEAEARAKTNGTGNSASEAVTAANAAATNAAAAANAAATNAAATNAAAANVAAANAAATNAATTNAAATNAAAANTAANAAAANAAAANAAANDATADDLRGKTPTSPSDLVKALVDEERGATAREVQTASTLVSESHGVTVAVHDRVSIETTAQTARLVATPEATIASDIPFLARPIARDVDGDDAKTTPFVKPGAEPENIDDEPSDGVIRYARVEPVPQAVYRPPPGAIPVDDRPAQTTGEIRGRRASTQPPISSELEPSILVADLAAAHTAVSAVAATAATATPTPNAATAAAMPGTAAAAASAEVSQVRRDATGAFTQIEEEFFRAGATHETEHHQAPRLASASDSFDDLDEGYERVGFWDRLLGRKNKTKR